MPDHQFISAVTTSTSVIGEPTSYIHAGTQISRLFGLPPARIDVEDVRPCHVHLVAAGISLPSLNQIVCALHLLSSVTRPGHGPERFVHARKPQKWPIISSSYKVERFGIPTIWRLFDRRGVMHKK